MTTGTPNGTPWPFLVPLLAVMALPMAFPTSSPPDGTRDSTVAADDGDDVAKTPTPDIYNNRWLVALVATQTLAGALLLLAWMPEYRRHFPIRITPTGILVGVIGVLLWVGICELQVEKWILDQFGLAFLLPSRPGTNPFNEFGNSSWFSAFLLFRFSILALIIPCAEELFVRGWLIRWVHDPDEWEAVPLRNVGWYSFWALMAYAVLTHPQEAVAAIVWFGLVHAMMKWTGRFWDCVLAHAVTNFLLGVYVMGTETWRLW
ncbi:MAG TPA: CAAX prenyl protease-related protein [Pirellulaceae bacterium]|nr:CAAX prenyl protease-related protein [Pirellulaceae bacterium]